ncbi:MAG: S-layer homology domain-containing protein [Clostridia bacterium]|jgi:hypothetical protein|nr:S-layer homology domain-containing protein [Clostridia bacterium]
MHKSRKIIALMTALIFLLSVAAPAFANTANYSDAIKRVTEVKAMVGFTDGSFRENDTFTRAQAATVMARISGYEPNQAALTKSGFPDVANTHWASDAVAYAFKQGIIKGHPDGTFRPDGQVTYREMVTMLIRVLGYGPDVEAGLGWPLGYDVKGAELGLISAHYAAHPNAPAIRGEVALATSKAIYDIVGANGTKIIFSVYKKQDPATLDAAKKAVAAYEAAPLTTLAQVTAAEALAKTATDAIAKVIDAAERIVLTERVVSHNTKVIVAKAAVTPLAVQSVSAVNGKQIKIEFNKAVNVTEAQKVSNYDVFLQGALTVDEFTTTVNGASAKATGKTVILTLDNGASIVNHSTTNKVVVNKAVGLAADATVTNVSLVDITVPTLVSANATGSNQITLQFSEPVTSAIAPINITLNDGTVALNLAGATYSVTDYTMTVSTYTNLVKGTQYSVKIASGTNVVDYVGYGVVPTTTSFTYSPVAVAPTYTLKSSTETTATIEFSHTVTALLTNASVQVTHTYNNLTNQVTGTAITNPSGDNKTFVITFANPFPPGAATMFMKYATGTVDANKIQDNYGNIVALVNLTVNTVADVTPPTATVALAANSNRVIEITFSEPVTGATNAANYSLKKGTTVVGFTDPPVLVSGNKYALTASDAMSGDHVLEIKEIRDVSIAQNKIVTATYSVSVPDLIAPFVTTENNTTAGTTYFIQDSGTNKNVRIYFSEAMNQTDLADRTKYIRAGEIATTATPAADGKSVNVVFATGGTGNIVMGAMRDLAGTVISGFAATLTNATASNVVLHGVTTAVPTPVMTQSTTTVRIALNDLVSGVTISDFQVRKDASNWVYPATFSIDNSSGKSVITLVIPTADAFGMDAANVSVRTTTNGLVAEPAANGKNAFARPIHVVETVVVDKMAPVVDRVVFVSPTQIQVFFKENLNANTIALAGNNGFTVNGGTLTSAVKGVANNVIVLTGSGFSASTTVHYNGSTGMADVNGNLLAAFDRTTALTAATLAIAKNAGADRFDITSNFQYALNLTAIQTAIDAVHADISGTTGAVANNQITFTATVVNGAVAGAVAATTITETGTGAVINIATFNIAAPVGAPAAVEIN